MPDTPVWEFVLRLVAACVLGGAVGYQREVHGRPAGLRTHILVCVGATLFTITSMMFGHGSDPSRIAANIVAGIGFLGAGTIIHQGSTVRGLTTAASLWTVAAIGMAVGAGGYLLYVLATVAAVLVLAVLSWMDILEDRLVHAEKYRDLAIILKSDTGDLEPVINALAEVGIIVLGVRKEKNDEGKQLVRLRIKFPPGATLDRANAALTKVDIAQGFDWE